MSEPIKVRRALLSVSDKTDLLPFAKRLSNSGVELISTGGTAAALRDAGLDVIDVSAVTGFPEMMDGRVKTLHPKVHGGLLALRSNKEHVASMEEHDITAIDLLVVNLYPFEKTVASGAGFEDCVENIDIGGPAMVRAAAKNHEFVGVVTDPADYERVASAIEGEGMTPDLTRALAAKAFAKTASYDAAISSWLNAEQGEAFPHRMTLSGALGDELRYGENPHQSASLYLTSELREGVARAEQLQGKPLSYNNLNDTDAAFELVAEFGASKPAVAIIKHANPCGVAQGDSLLEAYERALLCDPVSAFGGIIALNRPLDAATAGKIAEIFTEVIIAPGVDEDARSVLEKKKNLRLLVTRGMPDPAAPGMMIKQIAGGFLAQTRDDQLLDKENLKVVTARHPSDQEMADLLFAFTVAKHVKSNAIVYAKDGATVGIGAGQMNRLDSSRIAARKSEDAANAADIDKPLAQGSVVASDAFFPFADGLLAAAEAGATAIIQPGGSIRDQEVIDAANDAGLAMVYTGMRHFRH